MPKYKASYKLPIIELNHAIFNLDRKTRENLAFELIKSMPDKHLNLLFEIEKKDPRTWNGDLDSNIFIRKLHKELTVERVVLYTAEIDLPDEY